MLEGAADVDTVPEVVTDLAYRQDLTGERANVRWLAGWKRAGKGGMMIEMSFLQYRG